MRNKRLKKKIKLHKNTQNLLKAFRTQGMLLNIDDYIINTKDDFDLSVMMKKITESKEIRDQVEYIYESSKLNTSVNIWENYQKWGEIFDSYEKESDTDSLIELTALEKIID